MSNLLINESPLIVLPSLAVAIGFNEAVILQQVHFWLNISNNEYDGRKWVYKTAAEWQSQFRWWSESTINRAFTELKARNLIQVEKLSKEFGGSSFNRTNYFTIDYSELEKITRSDSNDAFGQNDHIEQEVPANPSSQNGQIRFSQNDQIRSSQNDQLLTEITTETTTENIDVTAVDIPAEDSEPTSNDGNENTHSALCLDTTQAADQLLATSSSREQFNMHWDWQPSTFLAERCKVMGINLNLFDVDSQEQILGEFRSFWSSKPTKQNQGGWEHKFAQRLKQLQVARESASTDPPQSKQAVRAGVTAQIMNISDTDW